MDTNNILQEFLNSNIKIKSINKLKQYIQFCDDKNQNLLIKGKSSHHHILPRKLFPQFSNLKNNKWNGTHLLYSDHYYAHWLLTEAIDNSSMLFAFCAMHNMDSKIGRINEADLINPKEFQKKMEERSKKYSKWCINNPEKVQRMVHNQKLTKEKNNSNFIGGQKCSFTKQSKKWKETIGADCINKHKKTKSSKEWKKTVGETAIKKHNITINSKEWKETIGAAQISKYKKTVNSEEWKKTVGETKKEKISKKRQDVDWKETVGKNSIKKMVATKQTKEWKDTIGKQFRNKMTATYKLKSIKKFGLYNVMYNNNVVFSNLCKSEICKISPSLFNTSKDAKMGNTNAAKSKLNTYKRLHLIGYYIEKINI